MSRRSAADHKQSTRYLIVEGSIVSTKLDHQRKGRTVCRAIPLALLTRPAAGTPLEEA